MKINRFKPQDGVSLLEVVIVIVVLMIVTAFALMQLGRSKTLLQRQQIAREFKVYLERARFDSVKRRAATSAEMSKVVLNGPSSFTATLDFNGNGVIDAADTKQVSFANRSDARIIVSDTFNYPVTLSFNQRGHITVTDGSNNPVNAVFTICSGNCSDSSVNNKELSVISVSTTGTIAILNNTSDISTLPTPAVTPSTPIYNCYALIGNYNSNQCTPN